MRQDVVVRWDNPGWLLFFWHLARHGPAEAVGFEVCPRRRAAGRLQGREEDALFPGWSQEGR